LAFFGEPPLSHRVEPQRIRRSCWEFGFKVRTESPGFLQVAETGLEHHEKTRGKRVTRKPVAQNAAQSGGSQTEASVTVAWATLINGDARLQKLLMFATAMNPEELDALLAIQQGMLAARKAVSK